MAEVALVALVAGFRPAPARAQRFASAPSVAQAGKAAAVKGGGVAAASVVSVVSVCVTSPDGVVTVHATAADAQGRFSATVTAGSAGMHRLELLDAGSQHSADLRLMVAP